MFIPYKLYGYLAWRYLSTLILVTFALGAFIFLIDALELSRKLAEVDAAILGALPLSLWKLPSLIMALAPFIILFATLLCFTRLNRDSELVAVRNAGLPARIFLLPALVVCIGVGVLNMFVLEPAAAIMLQKYERALQQKGVKEAESIILQGGHLWIKQNAPNNVQWFVHGQLASTTAHQLENVSLFQLQNNRFLTRYDAAHMTYRNNTWQLKNVQQFDLSTNTPLARVPSVELQLALTPSVLQDSFAKPSSLTLWELQELRSQLKQSGLPTYVYDMDWYKRLANPLLFAALFFLSAPFALRFSRNHSTAQILLAGLGVGIAFYLFTNLVAAYGLSGRIAAPIAAWAPTVVAGLVGFATLLYFREE